MEVEVWPEGKACVKTLITILTEYHFFDKHEEEIKI